MRMPKGSESISKWHKIGFPAITMAWLAGIGVVFLFSWNAEIFTYSSQVNSITQAELLSFITPAFLFGALGGLTRAILMATRYIYLAESSSKNSSELSPLNRLIMKPMFWPFLGAFIGIALSFVFFDITISWPRIAVLSFIGGLFIRGFVRGFRISG